MRGLLATAFICAASAAFAEEPPPVQPPPPAQPSWTYQRGRIERDGLVTIFYKVSHNKGALLQPYLQKFLTAKGSVLFSPPQPPNQPDIHVMMITDAKENMALIEKVLNILDNPVDQVQIEAQIIEKSIDSDLEIGAEAKWDQTSKHSADEVVKGGTAVFNPDSYLNSLKPGADPFQGVSMDLFNSNLQAGAIDLKIRALLRKGKATILSSPYVTVNDGETATINAGDEVPYLDTIFLNNTVATAAVKFHPAKLTLTVTPHVVGESFLDIDVKPEVVSVTGNVNIQGQQTPVFSTRSAETHLTVHDGQQVVIGGLVRTEDVETRRGLPILADIPIIGYLFGSTTKEKKKTEILFIMRPRIRKPEAVEELIAPGGPPK